MGADLQVSVRVFGGGLELADRADLYGVLPAVPGDSQHRAVQGLAQGSQGGRLPANREWLQLLGRRRTNKVL